MDALAAVYPYLPYLVVAIILVVVCLLIFMILTLQKARKVEPLRLAADEPSQPQAQAPVRRSGRWSRLAHSRAFGASFSKATEFLRANVAGRDSLYQIPWFMVVGESASGKTTLLESAGVRASMLDQAEDFGIHQGIQWRFFNQGVVLDVYGDYVLRPEDLTSNEVGWESLLHQLQSHRARRPLDGFVVALPCHDFLGSGAKDRQALEGKAAILCDKLWRAQKILGLSFPVYVMVTQCDAIPGFQGFCREIPGRNRQDIFGWSSPYSLITAFKPGWVDEAFDSLGRDLNRLQGEIFAERRGSSNADEVFMFPGELESLRVPLRTFLARMFNESAYHESFYFRGLYFCGDPDRQEIQPAAPLKDPDVVPDPFADPASGSSAAPSSLSSILVPWQPAFLTRLFEEKIFPESAIARPIPMVYRSKSRLVWGAQLTALMLTVILAAGVTYRYRAMTAMWSKLRPTLEQVSHEMSPTATRLTTGRSICDLIQNMGDLNMNVFYSWFIPASLSSPLNQRVKRAMAPAFKQEVLTALRRLLERRADKILAMPSPQEPEPPAAVAEAPQQVSSYSPENTAAFQTLQSFTRDLAGLQNNIQQYEILRTRGTGGSEQLNGLVRYLGLRCALPPSYGQNPYFQSVIQRVSGDPFNERHVKNAPDKVDQVLRNYFDAWFNRNPVLTNVMALQTQIEGLESPGTPAYQDLRNLDVTISLVRTLLASPDFNWLSQPRLDLTDPFYEAAVRAARSTKVFSSSLEKATQTTAENDFQNLRWQLQNAQTDLTGNLLESKDNAFRLSRGAATLQLDLENLLNLPFMAATTTPSANIPSGQQAGLIWDPGPLNEALSRYKDYKRYLAEGLRSSNPNLRAEFQSIALEQLESNMNDLIARAQTYQTLSDSSSGGAELAELKSFDAAEAPLSQILDVYHALGFSRSYARLLKLTTSQASTLLSLLDRQLTSQRPYVEKDGNFFWWHGEAHPALTAFDARSPGQLDAYLAFERQRIQSLSKQAEPPINFLARRTAGLSDAQVRTYNQWRQIVAALKAYDQKIPGNSVARLEDFIRTNMNKFNPAQYCQVTPKERHEAQSTDFFLQKRDALRRAIDEQCKYLAEWAAYRNYSQVATRFNRTLAGKFPFASRAMEVPSNEADPAAIRAFYQLFDGHESATHLALTMTSNFGPSRKPALAFLNQMEELRPLFASLFVGGQATSVMALDFLPRFRVNRDEEIGSDQIIGWTLRVGTAEFRDHEPERSGRWEVGEPVSVSFRWAKDSPALPIAAKGERDLRVEGRVATFDATDEWSLLSLLRQHQAPATDFPALVDTRPFTLEFKVGTVENLIAASRTSLPVPKETKVFVRISIMPPGKKEGLSLPLFPIKAPKLIWETP